MLYSILSEHSTCCRRATGVVLLIILSAIVQAKSYDVLYYANGTIEPCVLIDVTQDSVRYHMADKPDGPVHQAARDQIALIFKENGEFLLASQPDAEWKIGTDPEAHTIVTVEGRLFPAGNIQEHEDIIFYQDAVDSSDASVRMAETIAIIYQDGSHKLLANANEVALGFSRSVDFVSQSELATDAVASTQPIAAPLAQSDIANRSKTIPPLTEANSEEDTTTQRAAVSERTTTAEPATPTLKGTNEVTKELELNNVEYKEYAAKAVNKAEYLGYYLDLLCDQTLDIYDKDQAIENALKLFVHDSTLVQVSSVTRDQTSAYKIKEYLKRLSLLNYDKVELVWRDVQYVTKFRLASDGNYYGAITVEQLFRGFKDGRPIYEDITRKDVEIVLGNFRREKSGATEYAWDVLLSNIGVEETRRR